VIFKNPSKANPKRRMRRRVIIFAIAGLLIVCASIKLDLTPVPPSIEISGAKYKKIDRPDGSILLARFALTNNGGSSFAVEMLTPAYVRFETEHGWSTIHAQEMIEPNGVIAMPGGRTWRWLDKSEGFLTEATFPHTARRWQPVFKVNVLSERENWKRKLPKLLNFKREMESKFGNIFPGNWISDEYPTEVIWGPVIEITSIVSTDEVSLSHHKPR
jgi:hypothetical protein